MADAEHNAHAHWNSISRAWDLYSSPLRPCDEDLAIFRRFIRDYTDVPADVRAAALMLGVTPEIATMDWPAGTELTGVDWSPAMVANIWPGDVAGVRIARCADWLALEPGPYPFDFVIGDGSLNTVRYPAQCDRLLARLRRLTRPRSLLIVRAYTCPPRRETIGDLVALARAGAVANFHAFKYRLAMALQPDVETGIEANKVWRCWTSLDFDGAELSKLPGWSREVVGTIALYRDSTVRLSYPTLEELLVRLRAAGIEVVGQELPRYEMGALCPIVAGHF